MMRKECKKAFTFAEALLVLVIMGVIAVICIRALKIVDTQQKGYDTKADKVLSIIGQTLILMIINDTSTDDLLELHDDKPGKFSIKDADQAPRIVALFKKHMAINALTPNLSSDYFKGDFVDSNKVKIAKLTDIYSNFYYLQDGVLLGYRFYGNCTSDEENSTPPGIRTRTTVPNVCASVFMDVNGEQKPNRLGLDQYVVPIDYRGIKYSSD